MRLLSVGLLLAAGISSAQTIPVEFRQTYNSTFNNQDKGDLVVPDGTGGCFVVGTSYAGSLGYDVSVFYVNPKGRKAWTLEDRLAGEWERAIDATVAPDGTLHLLSATSGGGTQGLRMTRISRQGTQLSKTSQPNSMVWTTFYGDPTIATSALGETFALGFRSGNYHLLKFTPSGALAWEQLIPGSGEPGELKIGQDGNLLLSYADFTNGYVARKFTTGGLQLWERRYLGNHGSILGAAFLDEFPNGDVALCGSPETSFGVPQSVLLRLHRDTGAILWERPFSASPNPDVEVTGFAMDEAGNSYVNGYRLAGGPGTLLLKYNDAGVQVGSVFTAGPTSRTSGVEIFGGDPIQWWFQSPSSRITRYSPSLAVKGTMSGANETYYHVSASKYGLFVAGTVNQDILALSLNPR